MLRSDRLYFFTTTAFLLLGMLLAGAADRDRPIAPPTALPVLTATPPVPTTGYEAPRYPMAKSTLSASSLSVVSTWREQAETSEQVSATLASSRSVVQSSVVAEGLGAFQLANPSFSDESLVLVPAVVPAAGTLLFFESQIGYATTSQFARVQVSTNNGTSWTSIWSKQGSGGAGDGGFQLETVSLGAYAGMTIHLRFFYEFTSGSAYTETTSSVGWFIDDIQIGEDFIKRPYLLTGDPTPDEILMLEYINRARADANAESARLAATSDPDVASAVSYFSVNKTMMSSQFAALTQTTQPLAMNSRLLAAARIHSQDMLENVFQGHVSSSNPPAPNLPSDSMGTRITRQGYVYSTVAENVYAYADSPWHAHAGFNIDWGYGPGGMQSPAGHRLAIHNGTFREIGIGVLEGSRTSGSTTVGPLVVTQNFGTGSGGGQPLITGVAFLDTDGDGFYDPGEGLADVRVEVEDSSYFTQASTHGAYAIPVSNDGTYEISFQRAGHPRFSRQVTVSGGLNVKVDYWGESLLVDTVERPTPTSVRLTAQQSRPAASLELQVSSDLVTWSTLSHTRSDLPDGRIRLDASLPAATPKSFFRIAANWEAY